MFLKLCTIVYKDQNIFVSGRIGSYNRAITPLLYKYERKYYLSTCIGLLLITRPPPPQLSPLHLFSGCIHEDGAQGNDGFD